MIKEQQKCLIVLLRPMRTLAWAERWPINWISLEGKSYHPVGPAWSGFYDWLCDPMGQLFGVRYHPCDHTMNFVFKEAEQLDYAKFGHYGDVTLLLHPWRTADPQMSEEQDFLYDQVFRAENGETIIAFAKQNYTEMELTSITASKAVWVYPLYAYGVKGT